MNWAAEDASALPSLVVFFSVGIWAEFPLTTEPLTCPTFPREFPKISAQNVNLMSENKRSQISLEMCDDFVRTRVGTQIYMLNYEDLEPLTSPAGLS